ncbi:MAG: hypothetical protein AB9879_05200 [Methanothrix sp.]
MKLVYKLVRSEMKLSMMLGLAIMAMISCAAVGGANVNDPVEEATPSEGTGSGTGSGTGTDTANSGGASASAIDPVAPNIVMAANSGSVVLTNTGTLRFDAGMLTIAKIDGNRRVTVASLPVTQIIEADITQPNNQVIVQLTDVAPGDRLILTNGIGVYAECTVT